MNKIKFIILFIVIIIIALLWFLYFDPFGIQLGYKLNGGQETTLVESTKTLNQTADEIKLNYIEQVDTYNLYKNSDNITAQKWAENAKLKANQLADEYYNITKINLEKIGE